MGGKDLMPNYMQMSTVKNIQMFLGG